MAIGNSITVIGNVTRDPELRYTPSGMSVCNFSVAWNRRYERNGEQIEKVSFFDVDVWREQAENVAASVTKGMRVMIVGYMEQDTWDDQATGAKRSKFKLVADEVAPSLRWASAEVSRNERTGGDFGGGGGGGYGGQQGGGQQGGGQPMGGQPQGQPMGGQPQGQPQGQGAPMGGQPQGQNYNYDEEPF